MLVERRSDLQNIKKLFQIFPAVGIFGPRQCGKTILAQQYGVDHFFDLENPRDWQILENPQLNLESLQGTIAIDEIQRKPELFPLLRYLIDTKPEQKYLLLGSASPLLLKQSSDSLAGRIGYHPMGGFSLQDISEDKINHLWVQGSFPRSYLATDRQASWLWRENYIQTFLERDIPQLGLRIAANTLRRFWTMLAHYNGQVLNYSELARSFGVSDTTVRRYLEILEGTFMIRTLQPWFQNIGKRITKNPKLYFNDSGIYHYFSALETQLDIAASPRLGASYEGFVIQNVIQISGIPQRNFYFWRTHTGTELDLFWQHAGKNYGLEVKYSDAPKTSKSMHSAIQDLQLHKLFVMYPGASSYKLTDKIIVLPFANSKQPMWFLDEF
ncbi:MAG: ATP-binding protein [Spirochaetota bacterium]